MINFSVLHYKIKHYFGFALIFLFRIVCVYTCVKYIGVGGMGVWSNDILISIEIVREIWVLKCVFLLHISLEGLTLN